MLAIFFPRTIEEGIDPANGAIHHFFRALYKEFFLRTGGQCFCRDIPVCRLQLVYDSYLRYLSITLALK